ncbi:MAG: hypothetical protein GWN84_03650 [Gammaproteobacteria bacterium]|nr:hypothetical protein [Gammaproteobacteria bacterium]NIR90079.1 hypothetical protein [Gammaproteobacteria bacterium]NIU03283.1 hypothetical protein [Gammaproteobacteria bacterium]NIV50777.1 hypothetical protein [Gammaproteobacteria bacterium]NIV75363.1 hypothetical protein [Gammaproteobacteria bacterium]
MTPLFPTYCQVSLRAFALAHTEEAIAGDLFELCRGACAGRRRADEITLFKNAGGGHLDLMSARFVAARALEERE